MSEPRQYLNVPYAEKDEAKALGARFDPDVKKWFIPNGNQTPEAFARWVSTDSSGESSGGSSHESIHPPHWMDPREYAPSQEEIQAMLDSMI